VLKLLLAVAKFKVKLPQKGFKKRKSFLWVRQKFQTIYNKMHILIDDLLRWLVAASPFDARLNCKQFK